MKHIILPLALLTLHLPTLITAQCPACDAYSTALKTCSTTSTNTTAVGNTMDTTSVHCMCVSSSSATQMNTCVGCDESNINTSLDVQVLMAWYTTCKADGQFGEQQAVACWEGQPSNYLPCVENTGAKGGGVANGGGGVMAPTSSGGGPFATTAPTTMAKSDAMVPFKAHGLFSIMMIALGVVIGA